MQVLAEMLAAMVVGLAAAALTCFGLSLEPGDFDTRSVRKINASSTAMMIAPRTNPASQVAC